MEVRLDRVHLRDRVRDRGPGSECDLAGRVAGGEPTEFDGEVLGPFRRGRADGVDVGDDPPVFEVVGFINEKVIDPGLLERRGRVVTGFVDQSGEGRFHRGDAFLDLLHRAGLPAFVRAGEERVEFVEAFT